MKKVRITVEIVEPYVGDGEPSKATIDEMLAVNCLTGANYSVEVEDVVDEVEARRLWGNLRQVRVWSEDESEVSVHEALEDKS